MSVDPIEDGEWPDVRVAERQKKLEADFVNAGRPEKKIKNGTTTCVDSDDEDLDDLRFSSEDDNPSENFV